MYNVVRPGSDRVRHGSDIHMQTPAEYRAALDAAIREYEALGAQKQDIDRRLAQLAQTIGSISRLLGLTPTVPLGLTDAVRLVLRAGVPLTPIDVRDRLGSIGVNLDVYANDLAAVHTVLKRLNEGGEIRIVPRPNGKHAYLWEAPPRVIAIGDDAAAAVFGRGDPPLPAKKTTRSKRKP